MRYFLLMLVLLLSSNAYAQYRLLDVDTLNMEFAKFTCNRDPMVPELECDDWKGRASINADLRLVRYVYWKNEIHGEGTDAAFKSIGWHYELGLNVSKYLDFYFDHHSRHVLDQNEATYTSYDGAHSTSRFPIEDSIGIRFTFYDKYRPKNSLFEKLYP